MAALNGSRGANLIASGLLLVAGIVLIAFVFPAQIPSGLPGDISSGQYPNAIMYLWILSAAGWFVHALLGRVDAAPGDPTRQIGKRSLVIMLTIALGFGIFVYVGFLAAGFILILSLSYICGERGLAPWCLATVAPILVYLLLDHLLDVTLPTYLFS